MNGDLFNGWPEDGEPVKETVMSDIEREALRTTTELNKAKQEIERLGEIADTNWDKLQEQTNRIGKLLVKIERLEADKTEAMTAYTVLLKANIDLQKEIERLEAMPVYKRIADQDEQIERLENEIKAAIPLNQERLHEMNRLRAEVIQECTKKIIRQEVIHNLMVELKLANAVVEAAKEVNEALQVRVPDPNETGASHIIQRHEALHRMIAALAGLETDDGT